MNEQPHSYNHPILMRHGLGLYELTPAECEAVIASMNRQARTGKQIDLGVWPSGFAERFERSWKGT